MYSWGWREHVISKKKDKYVFTIIWFSLRICINTIFLTFVSAYHPYDFFKTDHVLTITVKEAINSTDHFRLKIHEVDSRKWIFFSTLCLYCYYIIKKYTVCLKKYVCSI